MDEFLTEYTDDNLSNFEGDIDVYTGEQDEFVNFAGASSFINEQNSGRIFVMTITNETDTVPQIVLLPSYASKIKGKDIAVNGKIKEVFANDPNNPTKSVKVTGLGSPSKIEELHAFLKSVPSNLIGFRVTSTNTDQLQQIMSFENHSPFKTLQSHEIFLGTHVSEKDFKDNMISVPTPNIVLGPETEVSMPIVKGTTTITFFVGGVLSTSSALKWKTAAAISNVNKYYKG